MLIEQRKVEAHTKGTTGNTMMGKSLLWIPCIGMPVKLSNGIADKKQSNLHTQVTY